MCSHAQPRHAVLTALTGHGPAAAEQQQRRNEPLVDAIVRVGYSYPPWSTWLRLSRRDLNLRLPVGIEKFGQLLRGLPRALDQADLVQIDRVASLELVLVMLSEYTDHPLDLLVGNAKLLHRQLRQPEAGEEGLADDAGDIAVHQEMRVSAVPRAGEDNEVREKPADHVCEDQRLLGVVQRNHQQLRIAGARRAQHVLAGRVAEIDLAA